MPFSAFSNIVYKLSDNKEDAFRTALELGIDSLEIDAWEILDNRFDSYRKLLEDTGMKIFIVHHLTALASADDDAFRSAIEGSIKAAENTAALGGKAFMLVPALPADITGEADKERAAERITEGMREVAFHTDRLGLKLCMENFSRPLYPFCTGDEMMRIAEAIPQLGLVLDSGNCYCLGSKCPDLYERIKSRLFCCHLKDWQIIEPEAGGLVMPNGKHIAGGFMGHGIVPLSELLCKLKYDRINVPFVIEQENFVYGTMREHLDAALSFLKK